VFAFRTLFALSWATLATSSLASADTLLVTGGYIDVTPGLYPAANGVLVAEGFRFSFYKSETSASDLHGPYRAGQTYEPWVNLFGIGCNQEGGTLTLNGNTYRGAFSFGGPVTGEPFAFASQPTASYTTPPIRSVLQRFH
jgi:hypothetical protein